MKDRRNTSSGDVSSTSRNLTISQNLIQSSTRWLPHQAQLSLILSTAKNSQKTQQPFQNRDFSFK